MHAGLGELRVGVLHVSSPIVKLFDLKLFGGGFPSHWMPPLVGTDVQQNDVNRQILIYFSVPEKTFEYSLSTNRHNRSSADYI